MSAGALEPPVLDEVARGWAEAWSSDSPRFRAVCTPDVAYEDPLAVDPLTGTDELAGHVLRLRAAFPDLELVPSAAPLAGGGHVCLPWRAIGTHRGEISGLPATHRRLELTGVHYAALADGRLRRVRGFFDLYAAAAQLGVTPRRGSRAESLILMLRGFGLRR